jgi:hypothetical protein
LQENNNRYLTNIYIFFTGGLFVCPFIYIGELFTGELLSTLSFSREDYATLSFLDGRAFVCFPSQIHPSLARKITDYQCSM